jgi:Coenzyme PQQ synthesis protein D (PqqD)
MGELLSQADNLEVHEVPDGYVVYQSPQDRVHYLNKTAAIVFEMCDGRRGQDDVIARTAQAFDLDARAHDEIRSCLERLIKEGLVQFRSK